MPAIEYCLIYIPQVDFLSSVVIKGGVPFSYELHLLTLGKSLVFININNVMLSFEIGGKKCNPQGMSLLIATCLLKVGLEILV